MMNEFKNPRARRLSDLWLSQCESVTQEQKDRIGFAYIEKVLNLGKEVAERFVGGDRTAYHEVGMRQGGAKHYEPDLAGFWEEMRALFPGVYTDEDIDFLVKEGEVGGVWHFIWQLQPSMSAKPWRGAFSRILDELHVNAHVYK